MGTSFRIGVNFLAWVVALSMSTSLIFSSGDDANLADELAGVC